MANNLNRSPIYVDTAFAGSYKALVAVTIGSPITLRVKKIRWVAPSTVGHQLEFVDPQGGNQLLLMTCATAGVDVEVDFSAYPRIWADFNVPIIQSGKAYIFADVG